MANEGVARIGGDRLGRDRQVGFLRVELEPGPVPVQQRTDAGLICDLLTHHLVRCAKRLYGC